MSHSLERSAICVTGGAGFIGSHVVRKLVAQGARVTVLDDLSSGCEANLSDVRSQIDFQKGSILDADHLQRAVSGCEIVLHLAAYVSAPGSVQEPDLCREINETGTFRVLEAARAAGTRRVVFTSSSAVYGNDETVPKLESYELRPASPYGLSKAVGELMCRTWSECYGLDTACLRLFNVYGPGQQANSAYAAVIAAFLTATLEGRPMRIFGDGSQSRDFVYVDDVASAFLLAADAANPLKGQAFNVGRGERVTINELAGLISELNGKTDAQLQYEPERPGDVVHSCADIGCAKKTLGYQPAMPLRNGLAATLAWYRKSLEYSS